MIGISILYISSYPALTINTNSLFNNAVIFIWLPHMLAIIICNFRH